MFNEYTLIKKLAFGRCYKLFPKVDDYSHSVLYLRTCTLTLNEEGILLKSGRGKLGKISEPGNEI